jgi:hypothetical protein
LRRLRVRDRIEASREAFNAQPAVLRAGDLRTIHRASAPNID